MEYTHRYIARVELEAETALFVGSGATSLLKDALVQKDHHGFPMIQGTSLAGVLRHALEDRDGKEAWQSFFGYQDKKEGLGAKVKISAAYLLLPNNQVAEGLSHNYQDLLPYFDDLPARQHVRITDKGVAKDQGLFENEVVYKGCRFIFEIELKGKAADEKQWNQLLNQLKNPLFRLGQGTRNGYGQLSVKSCKTRTFDLADKDKDDFELYLNFDPSFNAPHCLKEEIKDQLKYDGKLLRHYQLDLIPDSFFIFSSGYGDEQVHNKPVTELVVQYKDGKMEFEQQTLIPASSIKGAISHRTCFHYNKATEQYADQLTDTDAVLNANNEAVYQLFGMESGVTEKEAQRGRVLLNDLYYADVKNDKIFNHVAIDRFTGGALDGALFSEKVSQRAGITLHIWVEAVEDKNIYTALEESLKDICKGLLPLGGMTTKGHGIFTGKLSLNKEEIYNYV